MDKPKIKREVAIIWTGKSENWIHLYATVDAINYFSSFGEVVWQDDDKYGFQVDARYDFDEVVKYIQEYGQEG